MTVDLGEIDEADACVVDALARLALSLKRRDFDLNVQGPPPALCELATFMGLDDVLGVEVQRDFE